MSKQHFSEHSVAPLTLELDIAPSVPTRNIRSPGGGRTDGNGKADGGLVPSASVVWTISIWPKLERAFSLPEMCYSVCS